MNEIPSIWRTELWHPLTVHVPIVLLLGAAVLRVVGLFLRRSPARFCKKASRLSLFVGVAGVWAAIYTGSLADAIVVRTLCDPTVVEHHENLSYTVGYLFTAAALLEAIDLQPWISLEQFYRRIKIAVVVGLLLVGSYNLVYTAHLGVKLVYQQAAGVYQPTEECVEFE